MVINNTGLPLSLHFHGIDLVHRPWITV